MALVGRGQASVPTEAWPRAWAAWPRVLGYARHCSRGGYSGPEGPSAGEAWLSIAFGESGASRHTLYASRAGADCHSFELSWKPKSWQRRYRFLVFRKRVKLQHKEPVQLDLFVPYQYGYEFRAILTNKRLTPAKVLAFHNGRGAQEGIFAELKSDNALAYVPTRTWVGNQIYLLAALMAHNLARELQMRAQPPARNTTAKRAPLWAFASIATLRHHIIQRAGRLIRPQGQLTLSMSLNDAVKNDLLHFLDALGAAA